MNLRNDPVLKAFCFPSSSFFPTQLSFIVLTLSALLIFSPLLEGGTTHVAVMGIRLLILLLFSIYLWQGPRTHVGAGFRSGISFTVLGFLGLAAISAFNSPYLNQSFQWFIVLFSYALLLYVIVSLLSVWDDIAKLLIVFVAMAVFEACWAIFQGAWLKILRPSGTFFNPNFLAGYLVAACTLLLGYLCYFLNKRVWKDPKKDSMSRIYFGTVIFVMALFLVAIFWTGSRGGFIALFAGTLFIVVIRFGLRGVGVVALLVALTFLVPNPFRERLQVQHNENALSYARWQIWKSSVSQMIEHPFGVGVGLYQYFYPRYAIPIEGQIIRYGKVAQTAHNEYLQMGVELGVGSILIFWWGAILVFVNSTWILRQRLRRWQRGLIIGLNGAIVTLLTHAAFDSNLHEPALAIVLTLCVAIIFTIRRSFERTAKQPYFLSSMKSRIITSAIGLCMAVVLAIVVMRLGMAWMAYETGSRMLDDHDVASAIENYEVAISLDPGKALYHSSLGSAHFQLFQQTHGRQFAQRAINELQVAMKLNPLDGRLPGLLGHVYMNLYRLTEPANGASWLREARVAYQRATELEPFTPFYLLELAKIAYAVYDLNSAEASIKRTIELEPNFLPGRQWLAYVYLETERASEAEHEYREILERRQRYAGLTKDTVESRFLTVDLTMLETQLERKRPKI